MIKDPLNFTASRSSIEYWKQREASTEDSYRAEQITPRSVRENIPYYESIKSFNKIQSFTTPREKLEHIVQMYANLKTTVVDYHKGKVGIIYF